MLSRLLSPEGIVGLLLVFYKPLWWGLSAVGNVSIVVENADRLENALASGWGTVALMLLGFFLLYRALRTPSTPEVVAVSQSESAETALPPQGHPIELGDTARLFLTEGSRFVPDDGSQRRAIFLPALLEHWAGPLSSAVEAGRTFVAHRTEFDDCDIFGPGVFVLAEGSVEDTFHKCDWEEEWKAFWPATKPGQYVGVVALEKCIFRRCNFIGVAFVVKPDDYKRLYRRFTGDDPNGR
jgi:hypothetical protein